MTDDWEQFSASPYQVQSPATTVAEPFLDLDWSSWSMVYTWLATGKKGVWFDLTAAEEAGMSGKNIENTLEAKGFHVYAWALSPTTGESIAAFIVVSAEDEDKTREVLAKMGVLLG